jgi:hypothetical protein
MDLSAALRCVAPSVAAAAPTDGELALRTLLRALRPGTEHGGALAQLDALLALAPDLAAPRAGGGGAALQALPQVYAKALAIQLDDAAALDGGCAAVQRADTYLAAVALPALQGDGVRTDPSLAWQVCRTAARLAHPEASGGDPAAAAAAAAARTHVHTMCRVGMGVEEDSTPGPQIGLEAACMLAISLCDAAPKANATAALCAALFPRVLVLVEAPDSPVALIISELLPRLLDSLPGDQPAARTQLRGLFMDLAASRDSDRRTAGLALGCQFAGQELEDLRCEQEFWRVIRDCLADMDDLCRKRALFLLQAAAQGVAVGTNATGVAHVDGPSAPGGRKSKAGGKKAGKRGRRAQAKAAKVAPGWPQFIWAYQAIETSTDALSSAWVQAVEQLGQTARLCGGPVAEAAIQLDVEPWVQLLLTLGLRHRHPKVQQNALRAALRGTAYNQRHDALSNGDEFVLACCDLLSSRPMAASMYRDVRAIEASTTPFVLEVHAFLNRHVQHSPEFLQLWVRWFSTHFSPNVKYSPAAMLVWLQWLGSLSFQQCGNGSSAGLRQSDIGLLAEMVPCDGMLSAPGSHTNDLSALARQSVLAACVKLLAPPVVAPLAALVPILAWASPTAILAELECCNDGAGMTALEWLQRLGATDAVPPLEQLTQDVAGFLATGEQMGGVSEAGQAQALATSILLLCEGLPDHFDSAIGSIIGLPIEIIEEAHAHPYQPPGRKERAVNVVARLICSTTPEHPVYRRLQAWVASESVAAGVDSALRPELLAWAEQGGLGEHGNIDNRADDSASSAEQARAARLTQLQGAGNSGIAGSTIAGGLTLLAWIVEQTARTDTAAARTISDVLVRLSCSTGNPGQLQVALAHLAPQLTRTATLIDFDTLLTSVTDASKDVEAWWRCLSIAAQGAQHSQPTSVALRVLQVAGATLGHASSDTTDDIIHVVGCALTWLIDNTHGVLAKPLSDEATKCVESCLRSCWCSWRDHLQAVPPQEEFAAQSRLLSNVQSILHVRLMALPAWSDPNSTVREILRDMWSFSCSFVDLAPVLAWHCCTVWSEFPSIASLYCEQVAEMVCYTSADCHQASDVSAVHACESELLTRGILLVYLEGIAVVRAESLGASMLRALMALTTAPVHRTPSREYELDSPTHKIKTSVWQALCVLVRCVAPDTPLASDMHNSAVELAAWEHFPSERQYLDLFLLRLLGQCPELISRWLPAALSNYELRPQIAQGILLVAGFVLLRLGLGRGCAAQVHLTHFKSLFPSIVTWVNSGHRQLRSLAQVLVVRLVADCQVRAEAARNEGDNESAAEYGAVGVDKQLSSLHSYLSSATEGGAFRERLATIVNSFDAEVRAPNGCCVHCVHRTVVALV